jgi:glycosyltransferase involved in cell wall biosynthesis
MPLPRILWIPHAPWDRCLAQRPRILVERLGSRFEIHVVTWSARRLNDRGGKGFYLNPMNHVRALRQSSNGSSPVVHHVPVPLPMLQGMWKGYPPDWLMQPSQILFRHGIRRIHTRYNFDAVVMAASHHFTGYPPKLPGVPVVFDYLDLHPQHVEAKYVAMADRIVNVSQTLGEQLRQRYERESAWIPNGLDIARIQSANGDRARRKWGLENRRVISLIGLTCSKRLYFLDALATICREFPDVIFLGAGEGAVAGAIKQRCEALKVPHVMTGWVDPAEVGDLFAASDVGFYPGDDHPYFDGACPIKVLEYLGARVPVLANQCAELRRLAFDGVALRPATTEGFVDGLRAILRDLPQRFADMASFDWDGLAARFGNEIDAVLRRTPATVRR